MQPSVRALFTTAEYEGVWICSAEIPFIPSDAADKTAALLQFCRTPRTRKEIADFLGIGTVYHANKRYIQPLVEQGKLKLSIPDKPSSRKQTYTANL